MLIKKIFYKFINKKKYDEYKENFLKKKKIKILKSGFEDKISKIQKIIKNKKEISFLHAGHLGDILNSLPVIKEVSKTHNCNLYIQANKPLPADAKYWHTKDWTFLNDKNIDMLIIEV